MKPVVLIVEDEKNVLDLLVVILSMDYQVITAKSGEEAMLKMELAKPDLILLDIGLGFGLSGLEVCMLLKADMATRHIPILCLSGQAEKARNICMAAGANGYISKPYSPAYLLDRVATLLGLDAMGNRVQ
jgi:CheY-like chemotaxis protein